MATSTKPTAVHISLILFVMTTIIFGVMWYISFAEARDAKKAEDVAKKAAEGNKTTAENRDEDLSNLMRLYIGRDLNSPDSVSFEEGMKALLEKMNKDNSSYGGEQKKATVTATMVAMWKQLENLRVLKESAEVARNDALEQKKKNKSLSDITEKNLVKESKQANERLNARIDEDSKTIEGKDKQIRQLDARLREFQAQSGIEIERLEKLNQEAETKYDQLVQINDNLKTQLDTLRKVSFEIPDAYVRWVDNSAKIVWIDVGEVDKLPKGTTFSVYTQSHRGIARGGEDIKGAIEVTRIMGPHFAEARILEGNFFEPISKGDPIYSPIWNRGHQESFALVGLIDFDNDGRSNRAELHKIITAANGKVETEVGEDGVIRGPGITVDTKFLVLGRIPDPTTSAPDQHDAIIKMMEARKELLDQARRQGVRRVNLGHFLDYIGYVSTRRVWIPGETYEFTLKAGAKSTAVGKSFGNRKSTGQTSGIYSPGRRRRQPISSGQTSKAFGGSR